MTSNRPHKLHWPARTSVYDNGREIDTVICLALATLITAGAEVLVLRAPIHILAAVRSALFQTPLLWVLFAAVMACIFETAYFIVADLVRCLYIRYYSTRVFAAPPVTEHDRYRLINGVAGLPLSADLRCRLILALDEMYTGK